jgi:hypothetical protein
MPLLNIVGITGENKSFYSCFAFIRNEQETHYEWALLQFKNLFKGGQVPEVIITDKDKALRNALDIGCAHDIRDLLLNNEPLSIELFHQQWDLSSFEVENLPLRAQNLVNSYMELPQSEKTDFL